MKNGSNCTDIRFLVLTFRCWLRFRFLEFGLGHGSKSEFVVPTLGDHYNFFNGSSTRNAEMTPTFIAVLQIRKRLRFSKMGKIFHGSEP